MTAGKRLLANLWRLISAGKGRSSTLINNACPNDLVEEARSKADKWALSGFQEVADHFIGLSDALEFSESKRQFEMKRAVEETKIALDYAGLESQLQAIKEQLAAARAEVATLKEHLALYQNEHDGNERLRVLLTRARLRGYTPR